jgi:hypothetical protein
VLRPTLISLACSLLVILGCPSTASTPPGPHPVANASAGAPSEPAEPEPEPDRGVAGPNLPTGPLCDSNADCSEGQVCEGAGCEPGQGRCVADERMCTRDLATYCGCDGKPFQSSGSCPGGRYAYRGDCAPALEDGEACTDSQQCRSGSCVGEGLEGCSPGAQGVCGSAACTKDLAPYCSCNNTEFRASGSCPGRQFAYRGPCEGG